MRRRNIWRAEAISWAGYNLVVFAVLPLLYFRRRYSAEMLNLRSSDRRADTVAGATKGGFIH